MIFASFPRKTRPKSQVGVVCKTTETKETEFFVSVNNEMNATKRQESCFSSDYLIKSLIFAYKRLLSSSVSSQISAFPSYMTGNKAVSHAYAARYKLHIAAERRKKNEENTENQP